VKPNCFKAKFRSQAHQVIDHRLLLPLSSVSSFEFELPPHPDDDSVPVYHLVAPCRGTCVEDWMGLDIAIRAVGKVSKRSLHPLCVIGRQKSQRCYPPDLPWIFTPFKTNFWRSWSWYLWAWSCRVWSWTDVTQDHLSRLRPDKDQESWSWSCAVILCQDLCFVNIKFSRSWILVWRSCRMLLDYFELLLYTVFRAINDRLYI